MAPLFRVTAMTTIFIVIAILIFLIVTHELGHFVAAKLFGVTVEEFGIGYPPRAFLLAKIRGTEYTINWLPFGGFVRLLGEDDQKSRQPGSFARAKRWKQAIILLSGVLMNALSAWLLFAGALHAGIPRAIDADSPDLLPGASLQVSSVVPGSPAEAAGIMPGDAVLGIKDAKGAQARLTPSSVSQFVQARGGKPIAIAYLRDGAASSVSAVPANSVTPQNAGKPALGIGLVEVTSASMPWPEALRQGFQNARDALRSVVSSLSTLIADAFAGKSDLNDVVGPIGLVSVVGEAAHQGLGDILALAGFIAINLAVVNLLPIPALDGGRLVIVLIESLARRRAPQLFVIAFNVAGFISIGLIMIVVSYHDIARLLK